MFKGVFALPEGRYGRTLRKFKAGNNAQQMTMGGGGGGGGGHNVETERRVRKKSKKKKRWFSLKANEGRQQGRIKRKN